MPERITQPFYITQAVNKFVLEYIKASSPSTLEIIGCNVHLRKLTYSHDISVLSPDIISVYINIGDTSFFEVFTYRKDSNGVKLTDWRILSDSEITAEGLVYTICIEPTEIAVLPQMFLTRIGMCDRGWTEYTLAATQDKPRCYTIITSSRIPLSIEVPADSDIASKIIRTVFEAEEGLSNGFVPHKISVTQRECGEICYTFCDQTNTTCVSVPAQ